MTRPSTAASFATRARAGLTVSAEVVTWDVVVLRVSHHHTSFVVCLAADEAPGWLAAFDRGELDDELRRVAAAPPGRRLRRLPRHVERARRQRADRVGVEHEFEVHGPAGRVDFRTVLPALDLGGVRADPADPRATRLTWGVITADGREAEIATAPELLGPGFAHRTARAARRGQEQLACALPAGLALRGVSTHLNVSWRPRHDDRLARRWAHVFAPALMLLLDGPDSPGLLVRPRPGRLELGGEFCEGDELAAALAFAAASVRALQRLGRHRLDAHRVDLAVVPAVERFGWYVDRTAVGADLYAQGRACALPLAGGGTRSAGDHLSALVHLLAPDLAAVGADDAATVLADAATGRRPLPLERPAPRAA